MAKQKKQKSQLKSKEGGPKSYYDDSWQVVSVGNYSLHNRTSSEDEYIVAQDVPFKELKRAKGWTEIQTFFRTLTK